MTLYETHNPRRVYPNIKDIQNNKFDANSKLVYLHSILESDRHKVSTSPELTSFNSLFNIFTCYYPKTNRFF